MKTANKVISIIFYVLAAIFVCYSVYMIYYSASYISSIINSGYYSNVGFMDIMSVYFAQVSPYFFYACGFFGLGWVIGGNVQTEPAKKMKKVWVEVDDSDKTEDDASDKTEDDASDKTEELPSEDSEDTAELQKNDAETEDKTETFDPAAAAEEDVREVVDKQKADGDELASEIAEDLGDDEKAEKDEMKAEVEDDKAEEEKEEEKDSDK